MSINGTGSSDSNLTDIMDWTPNNDVLGEIGESLEPTANLNELCFNYRLICVATQQYTDKRLLERSIVRSLCEELSEAGECIYPYPIIFGTFGNPHDQHVVSQKELTKQALIAFFLHYPRCLHDLKEIYHGMNCNRTLVQKRIMPALFEHATEIKQQQAFTHLAHLSISYALFSDFMIRFARYIGKNIDALGIYGNTALAEMLYHCANHLYDQHALDMKDFLLQHGASPNALNDHDFQLFQHIHQPENRHVEEPPPRLRNSR